MPPSNTKNSGSGALAVQNATTSPRDTLFDPEALITGMKELSGRDKRLAALFECYPAEPRPAQGDLFANLCRTVTAQLLSAAAANAILGRLTDLCGGPPQPDALDALTDDQLRGCGLSRSKIATLRALVATYRTGGNLIFQAEHLAAADDETIAQAITSIKGLGPWTAHMFLLFSVGRLDIYSPRDAVLAKGLKKLKQLKQDTPAAKLEAIAKRWSPYRSVVSLSLWKWKRNQWAPLPK